MKYLIYIAALVILGAGLTGREVWERNPSIFMMYAPFVITVIFVLMTHALAVLTVAQQQRIFGNVKGIVGRYPEALVPLCVLFGWTIVAALTQPSLGNFATGVLFALALSVCYAAVRSVILNSTKSARLSNPTPGYSAAVITKLATRYLFFLRISVAVISASGLLAFAVTGIVSVWLPIFAVTVPCFAAILAVCCIQSERALAQGAGKMAKFAIGAQMAVKPVDLAIYYSGAVTSKHTAPVALATQLEKEHIPTAIIFREAEAKKALAKAPNNYLWFCPTINTLDAAAQPDLKMIFYVNDAAKNGHFIRFNDYKHVLRATGEIAAANSLPQSCDVYDVIIAPNEVTADAWRSAATPDMARRIVTVGAKSDVSAYLPSLKYPSEIPLLSVHVGGFTGKEDFYALRGLIEAVIENGKVRLDIWFPDASEGARDPLMRFMHREINRLLAGISLEETILERSQSVTVRPPIKNAKLKMDAERSVSIPLVALHAGGRADAANAADFLIATDASDLKAMRRTGKPLLWFGTGIAPAGLIHMQASSDNLETELEQAWNAPTQQSATGFSGRHFNSFAELVMALREDGTALQTEGTTSC